MRAGVALILLAACSGKSLAPDAAPRVDGRGVDTGLGSCAPPTLDRAALTLRLPGGGVLDCASAATDAGLLAPTWTWIGKVSASDATSVVVDFMDFCAGDAGCPPGTLRIEATAPGLDLTVFPRVWVQVKANIGRFRACQQSLEITTAAPLDGSPPSGPPGQLLLAVADGGGPFSGGAYSVDNVRLGCSSEKGCGAIPPDNYALAFTATGAPLLRVDMGDTETWNVGQSSLRVRNLRSFQSTACDDYWNFAYHISLNP